MAAAIANAVIRYRVRVRALPIKIENLLSDGGRRDGGRAPPPAEGLARNSPALCRAPTSRAVVAQPPPACASSR